MGAPLPGGATAVWSNGIGWYRHSDHLGSSRFASTSTRTMYSDLAYAPFGEPYAQKGSTDLSFTGQNQDTVSNLYDFPAREYGIQGRWASPDPAGTAAVNPENPQSWNRYAYVLNNPLALVDPIGLSDCPDLKATCGDIFGDPGGAAGVDLFFGQIILETAAIPWSILSAKQIRKWPAMSEPKMRSASRL